jgi:hypothetical protein
MCQNSDMMQLPYWGPEDVKHNLIKFSRPCDWAAGICAPLLFNMVDR